MTGVRDNPVNVLFQSENAFLRIMLVILTTYYKFQEIPCAGRSYFMLINTIPKTFKEFV